MAGHEISPTADLEVRPGRTEDVPSIVGLLTRCLGTGRVPRTEEFWRWKHEESPFGPSPVLVAVAPDNEIVAVRAFLRWCWRSGDRRIPAVRAVDTATHPDWRGRGLFRRLTLDLAAREAERGTAFVFNTPNRSSGPGYMKMGWSLVGRVPVLLRPVRVLGLLRGAASEAPDLSALPTVGQLLAEPALEELLERIRGGGPDLRFRTDLDPDYLAWRFRDPPGLEYRALWKDGGVCDAALIVRSGRRFGRREVTVAEVLAAADGDGRRAATDLLRSLARLETDHLLTALSPGTTARAAALRAGFLPAPFAGPRLVVRELVGSSASPDPRRLSSWRLSTGSLELF